MLWKRCSQLGVLRWFTKILVFCLGGGPFRITVITLALAFPSGTMEGAPCVDLMPSSAALVCSAEGLCPLPLLKYFTGLEDGDHVGDLTLE